MPPLVQFIMKIILPSRWFKSGSAKALLPDPQYGEVVAKLWTQELKNNTFLESLELDPAHVPNWYVTNVINRSLAHVVGQATSSAKLLSCTEDGFLKIADMGGGIERNETKTGNAPDAYGGAIAFASTATKLSIFIWDNDALFKRSYDGIIWDDEFELPANSVFETDVTALQFNIMNKTAGLVARYQVIGWR